MELLSRLERTVAGWLKEVPHLPNDARRWLGVNLWWIALVGAIFSAIGVFGLLLAILGNLTVLSGPFVGYYASTTFVAFSIVKTAVSLVFTAIGCVLLAVAVTPLKERQKKGWVLLFASWLVSAVSVVISSIITLNPFSFMTNMIFGVFMLLIGLYFLFEVHGQFAHVERSKGAKKNA